MQRIDTPTAVNGRFVNANPNIGRMATRLDESWFNSVQEELCNVVEGLGNELDKEKRNQIISALASRMFDYLEVDAAATPSITLSTLMRKTIVKMTAGRTLTINGEFDILVVIPGDPGVISQSATVFVNSVYVRVGRGVLIWGSGIVNYSRFLNPPINFSVAIDPGQTVLPNDIVDTPSGYILRFNAGSPDVRKLIDISAGILLRCQGSSATVTSGIACICNSSGIEIKRVAFKFLPPNAYSGYVPLDLRMAIDTIEGGAFDFRVACEQNVTVGGGTFSYVVTDY